LLLLPDYRSVRIASWFTRARRSARLGAEATYGGLFVRVNASARPDESLRDQATSGVLWAAAQKWLVQLSTLVGFVVLGRLLSPVDFGTVALAMTFIAVLTMVTDAGYAVYLIQVRTLTVTITSTAFYISTALGGLLTAGLMAASGVIANSLDVPQLGPVLIVLALPLFIAGLSSVPAATLERDLQFRRLAVRQAVATGISIVVAIVAAVMGAGLWALVAQHLTRSVVAGIALWAATDFRPRLTFSAREAWTMTSYGLKTMGVRLGTQLRDQGELFLIGALAGTAALGYWTVAGRLVEAVVGLTSAAFFLVAQPVFARLQDDHARLSRAIGTSMAMGGMILVPPLLLISLTAAHLLPLVFGDRWSSAAGIAALLAVRSLANALSNFHRTALTSTGRAGAELTLTTGLLVVQFVLVVALTSYGLVPLAISLAALAVIGWPLRAYVVRRLLGVPWRTYADLGRVLIAGGLAAAVAGVVQAATSLEGWRELGVVAGVGGIVYLAGLWLFSPSLLQQVLDVARRRRRPEKAGMDGVDSAPATTDRPSAVAAPDPSSGSGVARPLD
jgi:O-antigen/teichoic acid export membrane protein